MAEDAADLGGLKRPPFNISEAGFSLRTFLLQNLHTRQFASRLKSGALHQGNETRIAVHFAPN